MTRTTTRRDADAEVVRLRVSVMADVDLGLVLPVLGANEAPWLGERAPDTTPGIRQFSCDLELHAGGAERALFRKSAIVGLGPPRRDSEGWVVPIEWRAATLAPLFPVLVGVVVVRPDRLELDGRYAPPGGRLGEILDRNILGIAARVTGRWFLRKLAAAVSP